MIFEAPMKIGEREIGRILKAPFQARHYAALKNLFLVVASPADVLNRYLLGRGEYPYRCTLKTPAGPVSPVLYTYYDLLTLNEIFLRRDYPAGPHDKFILDVGANIGLSALYFLTRHPKSHCVLFEPDPRNIDRLKANLAPFQGRF